MGSTRATETIRRFYERLWNEWDFDLTAELLDPGLRFRGSLGAEVEGVEAFKGYMRAVRAAFPDFTNHVEELVAEEDRVAVRLTYQGTHHGELFGVTPTGRRVRYSGAAFFRLSGDRIVTGWVLGDLEALRRQLGASLPTR